MTDYVQCPCCKGEGRVWAITRPGDELHPTTSESFKCIECDGMRTIATEAAERWHLVNDPEEHDDAA